MDNPLDDYEDQTLSGMFKQYLEWLRSVADVDIRWFLAWHAADGDWSRKDIAWMHYDGVTAYNDFAENDIINELVELYGDTDNPLEYLTQHLKETFPGKDIPDYLH